MSLSWNALRAQYPVSDAGRVWPSPAKTRGRLGVAAVALAALALLAGCTKSVPGSASETPTALTQSAIHRAFSGQSSLNARAASPEESLKFGAPARGRSAADLFPTGLVSGLVVNDTPARGSCPNGMASVDGRFCVDRYEGSLVEVLPSGQERAYPFYQGVEGHTVRAVSAPGVKPQAHISERQAMDACRASGKRLCKPQEWRTACMGPEKTTWGYGAQKEDSRCNDHGRSPIGVIYPQAGRPNWGWNQLNDEKLNQVEGTLAETGAHSGCTNGYGVFDMVGNLHEWVDDPAGTFQGGYYQDTHLNGDGCGYRTTAHNAVYHDYSTGFRCCADPAP